MADEMKIVINFKGDTATVGISKPNCDPIFTVEAGLPAVIRGLEALVAQAIEKWGSNPRYPQCTSKLPSQETPPPRASTTTRPAQTSPKKDQPVLF